MFSSKKGESTGGIQIAQRYRSLSVMPRVWFNLNQMCDLPCFTSDIWRQRFPLYHTKIPPDDLQRAPWLHYILGGQWVSKSCWHHVSVNTFISTSLIDFMNSGFLLFSSKVEDWRPWIFQQLIWNERIKKQSKWTCIVRQLLKHLQQSIPFL